MNKYQEAWDFIKINFYDEEWLESDAYSDYKKESFRLMQELVDKATPKKPEYEGDGYYKGEIVYDTWICPSCGERYEVDYHDYEYCPKCGQHIDLGEEDE